MTARQRRILLVACLASLAIIWLHFYTNQSFSTVQRAANLPDLFIESPMWQQFNDQGEISRQLNADRLEQWPGEQDARLHEPRLTLVDSRQQHWRASARNGGISETQAALLLEQQVKLVRERENGNLVLNTELLRIADRGDVAETDQPVVLESGSWHVSADGFRAELGGQRLELRGNVRGIHE